MTHPDTIHSRTLRSSTPPSALTGAKPNFLGIGAAKAGTTTVAKLLAGHPQISFARNGEKELHFFDYPEKVTPDGIRRYFARFEPNVAVGEWSPSYLMTKECRNLIYDVLGEDTRFLVALRNPVDRAFAHYCHAVKNWGDPKFRERGYPIETLSFQEAVEKEGERLASGEYHVRHQSYFMKGLYASQLSWYFERFPRDNFYIYLLEDYVQGPSRILIEICRFLGVDQQFRFPDPARRLNAQADRPMSLGTRSWLLERYRPYNAQLEQLLGRDLSLWNH